MADIDTYGLTDKEQWEPIIEQTFQLQQGKARHQRVREAWSFDWQSHGDAAVLNRELLENSRADGVCASLLLCFRVLGLFIFCSSRVRMGGGNINICPLPTDAGKTDRRCRPFRRRGSDVS
jgi:hypothetical protein